MKAKRWITSAFGLIISCSLSVPAAAFTGEMNTGAGSYTNILPESSRSPSSDIYRTSNVTGKIPTNDWWSSLAWNTYSEAQYPHPLAVKNEPAGFRVYNPSPRIYADSSAIIGSMNQSGDLTVGHSETDLFPDAKVDHYNDWFVRAKYTSGLNTMQVTYGHGSPFIFFTYNNGSPYISFDSVPKVWYGNAKSPVLGVSIDGAHYGLYGPTGSTWDGIGSRQLTNSLNGKDYFSIAALPDDKPETLKKFEQYAYSHVTDTKVSWSFDSSTSELTTTYKFNTEPKEGTRTGTIYAMYPHQWKHSNNTNLSFTYPSVRGTMKTGEGTSFETIMKYPGVLPSLPDQGSYDRELLAEYIEEAAAEDYYGSPDSYSIGKRLGKLTALAPIADQIGDSVSADKFREEIRSRLENWFTTSDEMGNPKQSEMFYYNNDWGSLIGYPASYGSDMELNDHHTQYGYFLKAAAELARTDKSWAASSQYGSMVDLLIRDIASDDRNDPMFPFLRQFDPYAGHSWSSGHGRFSDGNNSTSSSESMNAWASLILWGEATGDQDTRDLGIYLYTTEMYAINEYWFDTSGTNYPSNFTRSNASILWGGKTTGDSTMWTANPAEVHGVNWLPITGSSLYLTRFPSYAGENYDTMVRENEGTDFNTWNDLIYMYLAISDPTEAIKQFESRATSIIPEQGNSKANTYHWIHNLNTLGTQDPNITSDYPLYAVFDKNGNKTYVVYNMSSSVKTVRFSDGTEVIAYPNRFTTYDGSQDLSANSFQAPAASY